MDLEFKNELALMPDLRHRLRQLRWFRATFRSNARAITSHYGVRYKIDDSGLTRLFFDWVEQVEARKQFAKIDRRDFIIFSAGLALVELIRRNPAAVVEKAIPDSDDSTAKIVDFWPEGFLYTNYCVCAIAAIFEQEFGEAATLDRCADDLRTWWTYRENVAELPNYAVAFLDRFLGSEPNWIAPDLIEARAAMRGGRGGIGRGPAASRLPSQGR